MSGTDGMSSSDPWSLYWQGGQLHSCITTQDPGDQGPIEALWADLAKSLPPAARVLDLASGNGAVPRALLAANPGLAITAADLADIAPEKLQASFEVLARVTFLPRTDICKLPFTDAQFDAATSQFGLEYAPREPALREAARVMKPGAPLRLLLHHRDSGVVRPAAAVIAEIGRLFQPGGLLEALRQFIAGDCDLPGLETAGQAYLNNPQEKTRHISGQILTGIGQVIRDFQRDPARAGALARSMQERLHAERLRLAQLQSAALDPAGMESFCATAKAAGFAVELVEALRTGEDREALVGWELRARRK